MVRGINKRVIEINETGNPYFDKAVLYMNDHSKGDSGAMEEEARRYLATIQKVRWSGRLPLKERLGWKFWLTALSGGALSWLLLALL
ncbi:MAG: hypothetical protein J6A26_02485 [Oscillospiraceae bacterium]|nr:hypothetical protein [Oscillospiraceae bacterium]